MKKFIHLPLSSLLLVMMSIVSTQAQKKIGGGQPLQATISSSTNILCNGAADGSATVTASYGTSPYTYLWSPGGGTNATFSNLTAGSYTVMVTDNALDTVYQYVTLSEPSAPLVINTTSISNVQCNYDTNGRATVSGSGGTTPYEYFWSNGNTTATDTDLGPGTYTVEVKDKNGCVADSAVTISSLSTLGVATSSSEASCFGLFNGISSATGVAGTPPYQYAWSPGGATTATATGLSAGTYSVLITDANGCSTSSAVGVTEPPPLVLTTQAIDSMAAAIISGGTAPYTYHWYPSGSTAAFVTGLSAGVYTVTVNDANKCSDSATVNITMSSAIPYSSLYITMYPTEEGTQSCGNPSYFYFPFLVSADTTERFNNCVVDIDMGNEFYGDSSSNGGVIVTQGPDFQPGTGNDYNIINVINLSPTVIEIKFGSPDSTSPNGTFPPNVFKTMNEDTLLNVQLEIKNCIVSTVTFTNDSITSPLANYTVPAGSPYYFPDSAWAVLCHCGHYIGWNANSSADSLYCCVDSFYMRQFDTVGYAATTENSIYNSTNYYGTVSYPQALQCFPEITDFNSPINAGVGDTLTITGINFGNTQGVGHVEFPDADTSNYYIPKMNSLDYISWSNTQIKIRLPGFVDSAHSSLANQLTVGGGSFVVKNACWYTATSGLNSRGDPFSVFYNIKQLWTIDNKKKSEIYLRAVDTNHGYIMRFDSVSMPKGSARRKIFQKAMHDWTCLTGMNWKTGPDTTYNYIPGHFTPGLNYVFFTSDSTLIGQNTFAETAPDPYICFDDTNSMLDAVMYFNADTTQIKFVYDTTGTQAIPRGKGDYYGVCLHELGHFMQLNHTTGPSDLMYYAANTGPLDTAQRLNLSRTGAQGAIDGARYSIGQSCRTGLDSCRRYGAMLLSKDACVDPYTYIEPLKNNPNFTLYPNPSEGTFTIATQQKEYTLIVTNILGQQLFTKKVDEPKTIVSLSNVANGMYFIEEIYKSGIASQKIIIIKK
jgi:hypothetical protein